jgi:hypothetical protein
MSGEGGGMDGLIDVGIDLAAARAGWRVAA